MVNNLLERIYFGNSIWNYLIAMGIFLFLLLLIYIFRKIVLRTLKKYFQRTKSPVDDFLLLNINKYGIPLAYLAAFYASLKYLTIADNFRRIIDIASVIIASVFVIIFISGVIRYLIGYFWVKNISQEAGKTYLSGISVFVNIFIWGLGIIFLLDNLGFKISTVIAGLGIGGIAVALAAQTILGDLFSYFVIFFDKPFQIGDFIIVDDKMGTVEYIGIKTTRLNSLGGEQIILANSDLTKSRIHNYKRMEKRRVVFRLGLVYNTPLENLKLIPSLIKEIIGRNESTTFDRVHFFSYGESSLIYEVVFYVIGPDYNKYMDIQQQINFDINEEFAKRKIEFAFPTRTIFVNRTASIDDK